MSSEFKNRCARLIAELGLGGPQNIREISPLTGGVASDIAMVDLGDRRICVKFALGKLKVAEDWFAPVHRNRSEYEWMRAAAEVAPTAVPGLHGWSEAENGFAMEFLAGDDVYLWKSAMLEGNKPRGEAAKVGDVLGRIHSHSAKPGFRTERFQNHDDFHAIRLEPYLLFTAEKHPTLAEPMTALSDAIYKSSQVLVHGDVSPKNIILRDGDPVILDAECATMGDPSFDVAFCLNHLILKAVHVTARRSAFLAAANAFWSAYRQHINWEDPTAAEARVAALLPCLMLARVDGKSPVEYLDEGERQLVRDLSIPLVAKPATTIQDLVGRLRKNIGDTET